MFENQSLFDLLPDEEAKKHKPIKSTDWKWTFADYPKETNGIKVFSCFACGGGSTMGYKLAGCEVLGCCEIDKRMNEAYVKNHHPKYNYLCDIRDFNRMTDLPEELYNLDILDGSPPCTTFSMAGDREDTWGKKKKFREGQAEQTLDDLSFVFIETAKKLQPKVVIMENVEGLLLGEAWSYVQRIYKDFSDAGYNLRHYLCKGEYMGIPQTRHRVFFIAVRKDIKFNYDDLDMTFNYEPILYGEIRSGTGRKITKGTRIFDLISKSRDTDVALCDVTERCEGKRSLFNYKILNDEAVFPSLTVGSAVPPMRREEKAYCTMEDMVFAQTFPQDYIFLPKSMANVQYLCGMSVPPIMLKRIVERVIKTGVFNG